MRNKSIRRISNSRLSNRMVRMFSILCAASLLLTSLPAEYVYAEETGNEDTGETAEPDLDSMEEEITLPDQSDKEIVEVKTAEELLEVAAKCELDFWSQDKMIELKEDISLEGKDFEGFPVLAGCFNGNGHTISGFHIKGNGYADGFFRYITATGIVQDLKLSGTVESENEEECTGGVCGINAGWILDCTFIGSVEGKAETGGIVGENEGTGTVSSCSSHGTVTGYDRAGGIVGANYGAIRNCTNKAGINSDSSWLEEEDEAGLEWLLEDVKERKLISGTDIGGIAGYSRGIIINSTNTGVVGYEHNGYNIGGIAGRQAGQILFCNNEGRVYGRKDVGGIVGQMEPYISVEEAESVSEAVQRLHDLVDKFLDDAGETQDTVSEDFDRLREHSDNALDDADTIADGTVDFVDNNVEAVNELANRLDYCMDQIPGIMDEVKWAVEDLDDTVDALDKIADAMDISGELSESPYDETEHARLSLVSGVGGEVYADSAAPVEGDIVTITVTPEEGYKIDEIRAEDASKNTLDLIPVGESSGSYSYSFEMPKDNVVVKAVFSYENGGSGASGTDGDGSINVTNSTHPNSGASGSRQIKVLKNGSDQNNEVKGDDNDEIIINVTPDSGCQASVRVTKTNDEEVGTEKKLNGRAFSFIMPDSDVTVKVTFSRANVIIESNAGGKADYTISDNQVTLTVRPNTGYVLDGQPQVTYNGGANRIEVTRKSTGSDVYTFDIDPSIGTVKVYLTFKVSSDSEAVSSSRSNLRDNVDLLQTQMQQISDDMDTIEEIRAAGDESELIDAILDLAESLSEAGETLSYVLSDLNRIANIMSPYVEQALEEAGVQIDSVIDSLEKSYKHLDNGFGIIRSTMIYINGKFDIQFAKLGDDVDRSVDSLFEQLGIISEYAGRIGDDLDVHTDILEEDMHAINDQVNHVFQLFSEKMDDVEDLYYDESGYEDISEEDIDASTDGKVERAVNDGIVRGDVNVGGIAGSMAIDEEDPEGNAAGSIDRSFGSRYLTKCVINRCVNNGQVVAKKNGAGGIAGYMNLGIVANSEGYGRVESTEGEYIGGICGESNALVKSCYALTSLDGAQYVGGIAGSGSKIQDCYAMVLIGEDAIHKGAIAGWISTKEDERTDYQKDISNNYFVSSSLSGLDLVSYAGVAQPVTYEEILETVGLPIEFRHLKITFVAEDRVVKEMEVKYGTPLSSVTFPETPKVAGSYGKWPDVSDQIMEANMTLEAEYNDTITTLPSTETVLVTEAGEPKKPYAYIDGFYTDEAKLQVSVSEWTADQAKEEGIKHATGATVYGVKVCNADLGAEAVSKLRLYRPYEEIKAVFVKTEDGEWQEISYLEYGQYIQVEMQGEEAEYCIVKEESGSARILVGVVGVAFVLLILLVIRKKKRHNTNS
ncbi:MAG: hypothetical protein PUF03_06390 [Lachnospiraceae bacterium]|nr:hypothetical protein [Lachnospiraceae bacterium]